MKMETKHTRRTYTPPSVQDFGTVTDLTATGITQPGADAKGGSAASRGR